jgi:hypothetical protein
MCKGNGVDLGIASLLTAQEESASGTLQDRRVST